MHPNNWTHSFFFSIDQWAVTITCIAGKKRFPHRKSNRPAWFKNFLETICIYFYSYNKPSKISLLLLSFLPLSPFLGCPLCPQPERIILTTRPYGSCLWELPMGAAYGSCLWKLPMGAAYGSCLWKLPMGAAYGSCLWELPMGAAYESCPWELPMEAAYGSCP